MDRATFEALDHAQLVELLCRFQAVVIEQAERLAMNSTNSSRPPPSDPPFGGGGNPGGVSAAGGKGELVPKNWTDGLALDLISNLRERIRRR
jgi:hypothetical protein